MSRPFEVLTIRHAHAPVEIAGRNDPIPDFDNLLLAKAAGQQLRSAGYQLDTIVSSPKTRAIMTASALGAKEIIIDERIDEAETDLDRMAIGQGLWSGQIYTPGFETFLQAGQTALAAIAEYGGGVFVSHAGTMAGMHAQLNRKPVTSPRLEGASLLFPNIATMTFDL